MKGGNGPQFPGFWAVTLTTVLRHWRMFPLLLLPLQSTFHEESPIHRNLLNTSLRRDSTHQHFNTQFLYAKLNRKKIYVRSSVSLHSFRAGEQLETCRLLFWAQDTKTPLWTTSCGLKGGIVMGSGAGTGWQLTRISNKACNKLEFKNLFTE